MDCIQRSIYIPEMLSVTGLNTEVNMSLEMLPVSGLYAEMDISLEMLPGSALNA
jgi:hypothetical protein